AGWFTLADVATGLHDKLVRRHGHVFDDEPESPGIDELVATWEVDKRVELGRESVMDGIPTALPALARAAKVLKKAEALDLGLDSPARVPATDAASLGQDLLALVRTAHEAGLD